MVRTRNPVVAIVLFCAVAGLVHWFSSGFANSEPGQRALLIVRNNREAKALIGEPMRRGFIVTGSLNYNRSGDKLLSGNADITIPVNGPWKGGRGGKVHAVAVVRNNAWIFEKLELVMSDGSERRVDLLAP